MRNSRGARRTEEQNARKKYESGCGRQAGRWWWWWWLPAIDGASSPSPRRLLPITILDETLTLMKRRTTRVNNENVKVIGKAGDQGGTGRSSLIINVVGA